MSCLNEEPKNGRRMKNWIWNIEEILIELEFIIRVVLGKNKEQENMILEK